MTNFRKQYRCIGKWRHDWAPWRDAFPGSLLQERRCKTCGLAHSRWWRS